MTKFSLYFYYIILNKLPHSSVPFFGSRCERFKEFFIRRIFKRCGTNVNVDQGARFSNGKYVEIGNNSSIGMHCKVPNNIIIGDNVMMGPNVTIYGSNHAFDRTDIPMIDQGYIVTPATIIEDDVWIGSHCILLPGLIIKTGTIVGAGSVVTKNFPPFSIVAGNPAKLIKSRLND